MSLILNIETSTKACSVALANENQVISSDFQIFEQYAHAETLNPMIQKIMKEAGKKFNELKAFSVSAGPGSYTGLRIGISSAKGFCYGLEIPLMAISSLEIMAHVAASKLNDKSEAQFIPMMDARRMEIYSAVFNEKLNRIENDKAIIVDENFTKRFDGKKLIFFGDGMQKCREILEQDSRSTFIDSIYPDAKNMAHLSLEKFKNSEFENLAYFEPEYLKEFNSHN